VNLNGLIRIHLLILFCFAVFPLAYAEGESFRCGTRIVSTGDRTFEVLVRCGEPDYRTVRYEKRIKRDFFRDLFPHRDREREAYREPFLVEEFVEIEEWIYNPGPTKFIRYLTFENGILVDIETGDYGY
jgi:hypothetical protein